MNNIFDDFIYTENNYRLSILVGDDTLLFQLGMSVSLFIAVVITAILVIFLLSAYIYHKRGIDSLSFDTRPIQLLAV